MWPFLFPGRIRIRSTRKAENERMKFREDHRFFTALKASGLPDRYQKLEEKIGSDDFNIRCRQLRKFSWKRKAERWKESEAFHDLRAYRRLKKDPELRRYYELKKDPVFYQYRSWSLTFEDHFNTFERSKWITRYYAGERFLQATYGVGRDVQLFIPDNVRVREGHLYLEFRQQQINGKYWDPRWGIITKDYGYTSGMVNTALSFRQKLGRFEVKLEIPADSSLDYCFWLTGDRFYPHINIVKFGSKGYEAGCFLGNPGEEQDVEQLKRKVRLKSGFYIFTFDWLEDRMIWKINDCVVKTLKIHLPDAPALYACLSLGTTEELGEVRLPEMMKVEWVRFYTKNKFD